MRNRLADVTTGCVSVLFLLVSTVVAFPQVTLARLQEDKEYGLRDYSVLPFSRDGFITPESSAEDGGLETASIRFDPQDLSGIYRSVAGGWEAPGPNVPPMTVEGPGEAGRACFARQRPQSSAWERSAVHMRSAGFPTAMARSGANRKHPSGGQAAAVVPVGPDLARNLDGRAITAHAGRHRRTGADLLRIFGWPVGGRHAYRRNRWSR